MVEYAIQHAHLQPLFLKFLLKHALYAILRVKIAKTQSLTAHLVRVDNIYLIMVVIHLVQQDTLKISLQENVKSNN